MNKIKWGIIGCGNVTEVKSGPAFNLVDNSELIAVMRRNAVKAEDYATRHNVPKWYNNADDLINDPNVNAIYIATPPNVHAELSIKALKAGKAVYVEKPMALNHEQCMQMIQASETFKTPLFVAYYRRALPGFIKVKEIIESGILGAIKLVNMQLFKPMSEAEINGTLSWRVLPEISGGGHFFDLASHQLDLIDFLFGSIQKTQAFSLNQANKYSAEDIVIANFSLPNNLLVNASWCFTVPEFAKKDTIEIIGEKGKINLSTFDFTPIELITKDGVEIFNFPKPKHVQQYLIEKIVNDLLGIDKSPSNGVSAARTNLIMDKVVNEYYS